MLCLQHNQALSRPSLGNDDREHLVVIPLDAGGKLLGVHTCHIGHLSSALVHSREIFKVAILANAHSIVIAHNHPSDDVSPSDADKDITGRLCQVGKLLDIEVTDHLIVGQGHLYYSFASTGLLERCQAQWRHRLPFGFGERLQME